MVERRQIRPGDRIRVIEYPGVRRVDRFTVIAVDRSGSTSVLTAHDAAWRVHTFPLASCEVAP